jgi:Ras-related protein Rab-6A
MKEYDYKIVFLGESGTGAKTCLINQIIYNQFENYSSTSVAAYYSIFIQVKLGIIKLNLWDTAGQERFRSINGIFIKDSHCAILGYDITNKSSFKEIENYHYNKVKKILGDEPLIYLVANKIDLIGEEEVSEKEAIDYAKEKGIKYFRVSAKTGEGVNKLLVDISNSLIIKFKRMIDNEDQNLIREITKDGAEIKRLNIKEKIEIILNKFYNY